ncbi:hypothetical protein M5D96_009810 [Drosophila gunungcola]|uniref:Uncharacterized protein n=1 Tax=Drosophila gunungcola TaxID=103775 RepID=A0A9Q0BMH1_9MUSC|nr:hypothetical protein M5D96_009810 [Drosophila gunungcola]
MAVPETALHLFFQSCPISVPSKPKQTEHTEVFGCVYFKLTPVCKSEKCDKPNDVYQQQKAKHGKSKSRTEQQTHKGKQIGEEAKTGCR